MLPACHGPIWVIDDLTPCFQRNAEERTVFLQIIFPLVSCGLSLLLIFYGLVKSYVQSRKEHAYKPIANGNVPETVGDEEEEETDLMLYKATSRVTEQPVEVDRPRGEIAVISLELIALLAEVGISIAVLLTRSGGRYGTIPTICQIVSWGYILFLVSTRLLFSTTGYQSSLNLWNHTTTLYGLQWLCVIFMFRSALIHPLSRQALIFTSTEFALSSLLLLIGVTSRKGNKAVLVQYEDGLEPSREPTASIISLASFSWLDRLVWDGYKKPLEISNVWNLQIKQQAASVLMDFRQTRKTSALAWRLLRYFDRTLLIQGAWTIFSNLFTFLPTWLLRNILRYVEDPRSTPANAAWFYVVLLFVSAAIQAVCDGQGLWIGRKLSVKLRAIIIGEIYAKALRRKASATPKSSKEVDDKDKPQAANATKKTDENAADSKDKEDDSQANIGTIINLMAIDSFKVSEVSAYLHFLWAAVPVQIIMAITLLYKILGFSSLAGIVLMILILPMNVLIARQFQKAQNKILAGTDARIHSTNEVLQNIRIIKYFAWEQRFEDIVNDKRRGELKYLRKRYVLWTLAATLWYGSPILITFSSFFIYTVIEGKELVPSVAFPALSMFALLRIPLDQLADMVAHVQESKVSIDRVEKYLNEDETEKYTQLSHTDPSQPPKIGLDNATLSWGSSKKNNKPDGTTETADAFKLIDMNLTFQLGKLNVIAGPTGSGKTSLLMALLGEMSLIEGTVHLPGGLSDRADLPIDPETSLTESIAYCAQEAWLVNATIKENITFAAPFEKRRYETVLRICALERDLQILDAGDQTLVGEKGISLSGGQKQRISLARAMYSNARHLLLDDCLSAVDSHTAKHIFREAIMGPLMLNRTCILVTHNVSLTVPHSDFVVVLDNGKVSAQGTPKEIAATGVLGEDILKSRPTSSGNSEPPSRVPSNLEERLEEEDNAQASHANGTSNGNANGAASKSKQKDVKDSPGLSESKATGSVKMPTIKMYLKAMGSWYYWVIAVIVFAGQQLGSLATNVWIRVWANAYKLKQEDTGSASHLASVSHFKFPSPNTGSPPWALFSTTPQNHTQSSFNISENEDVQVSYYLGVYVAIGVAYILISMIREAVLFWGSLHASWGIHKRLLKAVMHAKFKFFDSTPLGQLMNRFSKDVEAIDQEIAPVAIGMLHCMASVILIIILISVITPGFLIAGVFITLIYACLGTVYIHSSRDLKRLESVERSPLYQQFGETLSGIITIRAYGDSARFIVDNHRRINTYNRPYIYLWASNRWLAFRVDMIGALVSFFAGAFVVMNAGTIDAGAAGLSLTYAVTFSENMLWLVRLYSSNEQNMNSVERMKEYLDVEQEADAIIPESRPEPNWPAEGKLQFVDYSTRYRPDLDPVLKNVNFNVQPGEKVGIVGRTGAGKSSLALALFRGLEAEKGQIIIDGVDISKIGLQDLRKSITIVPQDPTLFTGTIRTNLDPFEVFTDEEIFTALRRVHLIGSQTYSGATTPMTSNASTLENPASASTPEPDSSTAVTSLAENKNIFLNLKSPVTEHGSNLSQGQRQLLCLARALLKNPRVLMMDEATASIDYNTDSKIQDTLRELKDSTIITIAHRLQTIIDYDKVLVLDHGEVVEFDGPWQLISKEGGSFRGMCENSGNLDSLLEGAKKAWEQKRLVDDDE
ncbi:hypothetical protein FQN54_005442 [Arachnomyces sp. PD_36]|nr:hypothetical protein FQN54_005442 [Arachnomyces sp. PD_36]